ncbi:MAG: N-acetylneuraminate synthase [Bacteroidales bacterium]|nr:N-acetylneuraminate synthase [Bacteroidales bacterium]
MSTSIFIIAEAGVNHNGSLELAKQLIDKAAWAGVDAVKFQSFKASKLLTRDTPKAGYQKKSSAGDSQYEMIQKLELTHDDHIVLRDYTWKMGLEFMSTPFDHDSIDLLADIGIKRFKVGSGDLTNVPYLRHMASKRLPIILSTGMAEMSEIRQALKTITATGFPKDELTLLHATTEYPAPFAEINLKAMISMKNDLNIRIGYSDHTPGIEVPVAAAALGARVIEKHFTLDKNMEGPDHKASLEPDELKHMVDAIRNIEKALGSGKKEPSPSEIKNIPAARKSLVAAVQIKKGDSFSPENLCVKRPGSGISPLRWDEFIGKPAPKNYEKDELI